MNLCDMELPECLEKIDGTIRIKGHRISLFVFLDFIYTKNPCLFDFQDRFDTLEAEEICSVLGFCNNNPEIVDRYYDSELARREKIRKGFKNHG